MSQTAQQAKGVRIVEFVGEDDLANAYAAWLLGRLGATVTRIVKSEATPCTTGPGSAALANLATGKTSVDCPGTQADFDALMADTDAVLCGDPKRLESLAGTPEAILERLPDLIVGIATTFGLVGPYAEFDGGGLEAQALSGVAWSLGDPQRAPLSLPPGIVEHQAGVMLAAATLLALHVRDERGDGRIIDIALADVLASYVGGNSRLYIHHGLRWHRSGRRASGSGGAYPYVVLPCKDGEVCIFGRTPQEWQRLVEVMGNPAWASDPRYQDLRALGQQYPDEGDRLIMPWLAKHSKAELQAIALEHNLILSPVRNFSEVLGSEQFSEREFFTTTRINDREVLTPELPFRISEAREQGAANIAAEMLSLPARTASPAKKPKNAQPLAGIRVLDFGWVWSAPWVGAFLSELGAEVIKVEHALRPDNLRLSGRVIRDGKKVEGPSKEMSPMFHQVNHGKLGITLNVKEARARELLKRLAEKSDIVIENMSPGTMERSELGYDVLRTINPQIVMLSMSAAGQFGPLANMRAYAPNMSSAAGLEALVGYADEAPIGALNFALGDPNASAHAVTAVLASLRRARISGRGSYIDLSQIEALVGSLRPYLIYSQLAQQQSPTLGNAHPDFAPHGIYPALEEDAWLTLAAPREAQWSALIELAADEPFTRDERYRDNNTRRENVAALNADIARWTAQHARDELVEKLRRAGLRSAPVLSVEEQWRDPHYAARELKHPVDIPVYGREELFQAPWRFSDFAPQIDRCGPRTGEHNYDVLARLLDLSSAEIDELVASGVVA